MHALLVTVPLLSVAKDLRLCELGAAAVVRRLLLWGQKWGFVLRFNWGCASRVLGGGQAGLYSAADEAQPARPTPSRGGRLSTGNPDHTPWMSLKLMITVELHDESMQWLNSLAAAAS